ncbi:MAG TPA: ABC transporter ATP-binding protein [Polyangiaceae bacterium]|jgi:ABC-2 type transport system ATP-binding protein|nr:ABC transporter ATP-binding protein [Polyangiaceae bacterium]
MSMPRPAIRLRHVTHRFGGSVAVDDLSLDVPAGEIFGFIGPNGAGKTTTIRIMATLLEPTAGKVEIDGVDAIEDPVGVRRALGYMPDHSGVYERITVREYLEFFAVSAGVRGRGPIDAAVELTNLGALENQLVATLSKGMRQRLGLARVLLHEPRVLVLDEPASDLDPRARIEMRDLLIELSTLGKTIFLSSHILSELEDICTSVGILERGRLLISGPLATIGASVLSTVARDGATTAGMSATSTPVMPVPRARVRIRVLGEAADRLAVLREAPGVVSAEASAGGWLAVEHGGDERFIAGLVRMLVQSGADVVAVEPERVELERLFMQVTKGRTE